MIFIGTHVALFTVQAFAEQLTKFKRDMLTLACRVSRAVIEQLQTTGRRSPTLVCVLLQPPLIVV
jgi:hypothetical protein